MDTQVIVVGAGPVGLLLAAELGLRGAAVTVLELARTIQSGEWSHFINAVPPHSAYVIAKAARLCAVEWQNFAATLEERSTQRTG